MKRDAEFVKDVLDEFGPVQPFKPCAYYDEAGDCIEFLFANRPFYAKRLDRWVTLYFAEGTDDIVGGLIKDLKGLMTLLPGLDIEIDGGRVKVACVLRASAWSSEDTVAKQKYKTVIERAEQASVSAEYELAC